MSDASPIGGNDLWVKVVSMLQQNWASVELTDKGIEVSFVTDAGQIFDRLTFSSAEEAQAALERNGFRRFEDASDLRGLLRAPVPPFVEGSHPSGPIYSSGRFWR
jgi:hypothetical protein